MKDYPKVRTYPLEICDGCINLEGEACNTPGCAFIRNTTEEIKELLNVTQIRPLIDGRAIYTLDPINPNEPRQMQSFTTL